MGYIFFMAGAICGIFLMGMDFELEYIAPLDEEPPKNSVSIELGVGYEDGENDEQ